MTIGSLPHSYIEYRNRQRTAVFVLLYNLITVARTDSHISIAGRFIKVLCRLESTTTLHRRPTRARAPWNAESESGAIVTYLFGKSFLARPLDTESVDCTRPGGPSRFCMPTTASPGSGGISPLLSLISQHSQHPAVCTFQPGNHLHKQPHAARALVQPFTDAPILQYE